MHTRHRSSFSRTTLGLLNSTIARLGPEDVHSNQKRIGQLVYHNERVSHLDVGAERNFDEPNTLADEPPTPTMFGGFCINCSTEDRSGSADSVDNAINENDEPELKSQPLICLPLRLTAARTCGASRSADSTV